MAVIRRSKIEHYFLGNEVPLQDAERRGGGVRSRIGERDMQSL